MAPPAPEIPAPQVFDVKTLCILPCFDGNPSELYDFIKVSVTLLNHYFDARPENIGCIQNVLILQGIISKIKGRAKEVISIYGCNSWESIKETLIQNFGDQRDENSLTRDLVNLRQLPNDTPMQFYERVMALLNTANNYVELHNNNAAITASKRSFFRQQALKTFLAGLREPIGSTIRAMRPQSLADAIQYIQEELNIRYLQRNHVSTQDTLLRRPIPETSRPQLQQNFAPRFHQPNSAPRFYQPNPAPRFYQPNFAQPRLNHFQNQNQARFPQGPVHIRPHTNFQQNRFPTNQQVFGKPINVWKPNPHTSQQLPRPTPMSTTTSLPKTFSQRNPAQNQQGQKFGTEQLFNIEQENLIEDNEYPDSHPEEYEQEAYGYYYLQEAPLEDTENAGEEQNENFHSDTYPNNET